MAVTEGCGALPGLYPCELVMALPLRGGCRHFTQRYLSGGAAMHPSGRCAASSPSRGAFGGCLNTGSAGKDQSSRRLRRKTKQPAAATMTSRAYGAMSMTRPVGETASRVLVYVTVKSSLPKVPFALSSVCTVL